MARRGSKRYKDTDTPPLFGPDSAWRPTPVSELPSWEGVSRIGLDIEGRDPTLTKGGPTGRGLGPGVRRDGYICGVSFAFEDGPGFYLPTRHRGGDNLPEGQVFKYLKAQTKLYKGPICGANLGYDLDYLAERGVTFWDNDLRDIQVAEPLIDENQLKYSLEAVSTKYGFEGKNETLLKEAAQAWGLNPKADLWKLPARFVGAYAEEDAHLPLKVLRRQERIIDEDNLWQIYDLERAIQPILIKMRRRGVRIDFDHLDKVEAWTLVQEKIMLDEIFRLTNIRIHLDEINKKTKTAAVLDVAGLPYDYTPTGEPKIDTDLLLPLAKNNKIASAIIHAKYLNKLRNTFVKSIRMHQTNGRIHSTLNQLKRQERNSDNVMGAGPGRMSSSNPNLQQQPGRLPGWWELDTPVHIFWRKIYLPDEGGTWAALDYSGQEPRMMVHFANLCNSPGAAVAVQRLKDGYDFHDVTTELAFGMANPGKEASEELLTKFANLRGKAKIIFLGIVYGMGGGKLCRSLGFPVAEMEIRGEMMEVAGPEGKAFLKNFHKNVPFLEHLKETVEAVAWNRRFIRTLLDRHIHYQAGMGNERKATNNLIQGSSADQMKTAMVEIYKAGYSLQLQVHDECDTTVGSRKEAKEMAEIMEHCVELTVPSKVDVEMGISWGHSMEKKAA